jgi:N-acetylglutamate synthase-like GNAT family acetyltransferase
MEGAAPRRMGQDEDMGPVLSLLTMAFSFMEGRIDPPSSLGRMGVAELSRAAAEAELWVIEGESGPLACMILTPQAETLYLGKLAVAHAARGMGLARQMIGLSVARARELGLPSVSLQTRVELMENHATFAALGFEMVGTTAHPGYDRPTTVNFRMTV